MQNENLRAIDLQLLSSLMEMDENDKLTSERVKALCMLRTKCIAYQKEFNNNPLILDICAKKIDFILKAKSKSELKEILSHPKVHYNGNVVIHSGRFNVEEEELLIWSLTSLWAGGPLNSAGFKRYMKLFKQFYPEFADQIGA